MVWGDLAAQHGRCRCHCWRKPFDAPYWPLLFLSQLSNGAHALPDDQLSAFRTVPSQPELAHAVLAWPVSRPTVACCFSTHQGRTQISDSSKCALPQLTLAAVELFVGELCCAGRTQHCVRKRTALQSVASPPSPEKAKAHCLRARLCFALAASLQRSKGIPVASICNWEDGLDGMANEHGKTKGVKCIKFERGLSLNKNNA